MPLWGKKKPMSVTEAADRLQVSRQWVLELIERKTLRAEMLGNQYAIDRDSVEEEYQRRKAAGMIE